MGYTAAEWAKAVLGNGLGRPRDAVAAAQRATAYEGDVGFSKWALVELVEAAVHCGMADVAVAAYERLSAMTEPAATDWALGLWRVLGLRRGTTRPAAGARCARPRPGLLPLLGAASVACLRGQTPCVLGGTPEPCSRVCPRAT